MSDSIIRQLVVDVFGNTHIEEIKKLPSAEQTTCMVDKSNFDMNQYKADLETAHDCGEAKWLKCIEDIKAEIEKRKEIAVRAMFDSHFSLKEQTRGLINGYDSDLKTIDRHVNKLRGDRKVNQPLIEQNKDGNYTAYCPYCKKAIWKTFKQKGNEDED